MSNKARMSSSRFQIRPATQDDVAAITDVFFHAFNAKFWAYFVPETPYYAEWCNQSWLKGLENPTDRTFVAVDTERDGRVVAFSRWQVPLEDGSMEHDSWGDIQPEKWHMDIVEPFFGGMDVNREKIMEKRPHWFLDMLAVHEEYQRNGIAASLIKWGTDQADEDGVETMLHGSEVGQPYYIKWHCFKAVGDIPIPDKPEYGSFHYKTLVRTPQK